VNQDVLEVIAQFTEVRDAAQLLELSSLELVQLAEALEARFDFVVAARELNGENFSSVARIDAFVARKRGGP
jgi:acyl carrier protein